MGYSTSPQIGRKEIPPTPGIPTRRMHYTARSVWDIANFHRLTAGYGVIQLFPQLVAAFGLPEIYGVLRIPKD